MSRTLIVRPGLITDPKEVEKLAEEREDER